MEQLSVYLGIQIYCTLRENSGSMKNNNIITERGMLVNEVERQPVLLDGVIQAEEERRGGDTWRWITMSSVPLLQSRTMRRFPNLSPDDEGSLYTVVAGS